jgi:type IV secretory pathway VirB2 component (pilin)
MRMFRWGIVFACAGLQLVMKAPFWFLLERLDLTGSSNGWYRAALVDNFIRHFDQWWLIGTIANRQWADGAMWDACNQFVAEGVEGGLATLICFIAMICICFRWLGKARRSAAGDRKREWFFWLLGVTLFAHIVGFLGIDYFDQMKFVWYALLAMIGAAVATPATATVPVISPSSPLPFDTWQAEPEGLGPLLEGKPWAGQDNPPSLGPEGSYPIDFGHLRSK